MKNLNKIKCISYNETLENVLNCLEDSEIKTIAVYDSQKVVIGTITDGDIRRALLEKKKKDLLAIDICNQNFYFVNSKNENKKAADFIKTFNIKCVPIINRGGKVSSNLKLEVFTNKISSKYFFDDVTGFIFAGGRGTRMKELTDDLPKPLLKINNKPMIDYVIDEYINFGINNIYVSVGYLGSKIVNYLSQSRYQKIQFTFIEEKVPLGTAGSLSEIDSKQKGLIVCRNADVISKVNLFRMIESHINNKADMTLGSSVYTHTVPFGVIDHNNKKFININEKPLQQWQIYSGINIIDANICKSIKKNEFINMPDLVIKAKKNKKNIIVFPLHETWNDIGTPNALRSINKNI